MSAGHGSDSNETVEFIKLRACYLSWTCLVFDAVHRRDTFEGLQALALVACSLGDDFGKRITNFYNRFGGSEY